MRSSRSADFLHPRISTASHGRIYAAMLDLFEHREPLEHRHGPRRRWSASGSWRASAAQATSPRWATTLHRRPRRAVRRIVERKALLRRFDPGRRQDRGDRLRGRPDIEESIDRSEAELFAVSQRRSGRQLQRLKALLHDALRPAGLPPRPRGEIVGIPRVFRTWTSSRPLPGERPDRAGGPASVGKRPASRSTSPNMPRCAEGKTVGVFSLEMSKEQLRPAPAFRASPVVVREIIPASISPQNGLALGVRL